MTDGDTKGQGSEELLYIKALLMIFKIKNLKLVCSNSFVLKRERTLSLIWQTFQAVYLVQYERFKPSNVPDRSPFLNVSKCFMTVSELFWS